MINTTIGAGAASRYGSGSDQKMRLWLRLRNTGEKREVIISAKKLVLFRKARAFEKIVQN
jgi:hypothetical protein